MKSVIKKLFALLLAIFVFSNLLNAQTHLSTTSLGGTVGLEMDIDDFGHITNLVVGTTPDNFREVNWVDYMSSFVKLNAFPLLELKENSTVLLTVFDGAPAHPSGNSN